MRTKIYIENNLLDLYKDVDTTLTFSIDDVKRFGNRDTNYSKTITIPGNSTNNKIFGNIFQFSSSNEFDSNAPNVGTNFNAAISASCFVLVDNIQVFKGKLRVLEIVDTNGAIEYETFIFGELGGLMNEIGNRRLSDLDFSAYDLTYSLTNIVNSWNTVSGSGVYFALTDYGGVSTDKINFQYSAYRPALYVREYLEKIFSATNYNVESNFLLSSVFDNLIIPHNQKELTKNSSLFFQGAPENTTYNSTGAQIQVRLTASSLGSFVLQSGDTALKNTGSAITTDLVFNITGLWLLGGMATFNIRKNGTVVGSTLLGSGFSGNYFTRVVTANNISVNNNDVITLTLDWSPSQAYNLQVSAGSVQFQSSTPARVRVNLNEGIKINDAIPQGIFQKDFLLSIIKMFNLYVYELPFENDKLVITPYVNFYPTEKQTALDWSNKVDRSQAIRQTPMSELNARYYEFKYKSDNDFYSEDYKKAFNEGYGDRIFDTEFEFSTETDTIELIFAASTLYQNIGTDKVYPAIYKLSGATETPMDHIIRIGRAKKMACSSYNILNNTTVLGAQTYYGYVGHVDDPVTPTSDINFGAPRVLQFTPTEQYPTANLFNSFYSEYIGQITDKDSKLITCKMHITNIDIMQLNFAKYIYLDGVLFRLNKIVDYNPIQLNVTEVQLLKVV